MRNQWWIGVPSLLLTLSAAGCLGSLEEEEEEHLASVGQQTVTANALTANALTANALTANALRSDPNAREVLKYIASCALPAGKKIDLTLDGVTYTFIGEIGLAPYWGENNGYCYGSCVDWVSACVLSRVNYLGQTMSISIRGSQIALSSTAAEQQTYLQREATYYGDIFSSPQERYACLSPGKTEIPRVCGPSVDGCVMTVTGACDQTCDSEAGDGSFPRCRNVPRNANDQFPGGARLFQGSITVFLQ
jgi:hypothetical protein